MDENLIMKSNNNELISIVVPAFNEERCIETLLTSLRDVFSGSAIRYEAIIVDDGSNDGTFETIQKLSPDFNGLKAIRFSRNFGKESAMLAGLKAAKGDAVITMDADLQHPPSVILQLVEKWREGYKIVHAVKLRRDSDGLYRRWRSELFNLIFKMLGGINIKNSSDFILMDQRAKDVIAEQLPERMRFYRGLAHWIGFKQTTVYFDVSERWDKSKCRWSLSSLFNLATSAMVSFTSIPLRIVTFLGAITLLIGLVIGMDALVSWIEGKAVSGFATTIMTLLMLGSFIMISLGIIGEYLANIFQEIKSRPTCVIESTFGFGAATTDENQMK